MKTFTAFTFQQFPATIYVIAVAASAAFVAVAAADDNCKKTTPEQNLAFVTNFFTKIINETNRAYLDQVSDTYIQHNPWARDGKVGLIEDLIPLTPPGSLTIARSIANEEYVWIHSKITFNEKPHAFVDIFRMECGRAVEHWDVIMEMIPSKINDHAYF